MIAWIKQRFRRIQRWPQWLFWPLVWLLRGYLLLMRKEIRDPQQLLCPERFPMVAVLWHNRLFFYPLMLDRRTRQRTANLVSASRDGQYLADLMTLLGFRVIRGSTRKRAAIALRGALAELRRGNAVGISPDGPRGPCYQLSRGPIILASRTGLPVLILAINHSHYWTLRSWDRYQIPKPWARVEMIAGGLVHIPPDLDEAGIEYWRREIERQLNDLNQVPEPERIRPDAPVAEDHESATGNDEVNAE